MKKKIRIYFSYEEKTQSTGSPMAELFPHVLSTSAVDIEIDESKVEDFIEQLTQLKWISFKIENGIKYVNTKYIASFEILN